MTSSARFRLVALSLTLTLLGMVLWTRPAAAQERGQQFPRVSPNGTVSQAIGVTTVRITYGRPSVRGRTIFGDLVPYGEVWRTGANEATTITFQHDVQIEGQPLAAGTYGLFTLPSPDGWTVIFNRTANQWGAFSYDAAQDALRVAVTPETTDRSWEMLTFVFEDVSDTSGQAVLYWANTKVPFTITTDTPAHIQAAANEAARSATEWQAPYQYASYALNNEMMLDEALDWVDASIALQETYQNLALKARLMAEMDHYGEAVSVGQRAVDMAASMNDAPQGLDELREQISTWQSQM